MQESSTLANNASCVKARGGFEPGFNLGSNFSFLLRVQTWVQLGFELLEEFELFQGSENSILNQVQSGFLLRSIQPGFNLF